MSRLTLTSSQAFVVLTSGLLAGSSAATAAIVLPAATISTQCESGQNGLIAGTASCSQAYADGSDNVTANLLPFAGLSTNAAVSGFVIDGYSGFATLDYSFEVVGGNPGDQVPLLIFTNLFTSIGGDAYAFSEIIVSNNSSSLGSVVACQSYGGTCPPTPPLISPVPLGGPSVPEFSRAFTWRSKPRPTPCWEQQHRVPARIP